MNEDAVEERMNGRRVRDTFSQNKFLSCSVDARVAFQIFPPTKTTKNYFSQNKMKGIEWGKLERNEMTTRGQRPKEFVVVNFVSVLFCVRA